MFWLTYLGVLSLLSFDDNELTEPTPLRTRPAIVELLPDEAEVVVAVAWTLVFWVLASVASLQQIILRNTFNPLQTSPVTAIAAAVTAVVIAPVIADPIKPPLA